MADTMTISELMEIAKSGAKVEIKRPPVPPTEIRNFDALVEKIDGLANALEAKAEADRESAKVQLEVIATLQQLIKTLAKGKAIDIRPLETAIKGMKPAPIPVPQAPYEFSIQRGKHGLTEKIIATPMRAN